MLKDILIKSAELLGRDDIIAELNNPTNQTNNSLQNDILRLISYYNFVVQNLCENYFQIEHTDTLKSNKDRKIYLSSLSFQPSKILSVKKENSNQFFSTYSTYILVPNSSVIYNINYSYIPDQILDINSKEILPKNLSQKIVCYGIVSEFLACKNLFNESVFWNNKFMFEIYKSKTNSNKRLKATFKLW